MDASDALDAWLPGLPQLQPAAEQQQQQPAGGAGPQPSSPAVDGSHPSSTMLQLLAAQEGKAPASKEKKRGEQAPPCIQSPDGPGPRALLPDPPCVRQPPLTGTTPPALVLQPPQTAAGRTSRSGTVMPGPPASHGARPKHG